MSEHQATREDHRPEAIRRRLAEPHRHDYIADAVLGAIDGCVTTFAVVAGATGGALSPHVVVILGLSNLVADGFSMAVSNYHGTRSEQEQLAQLRAKEARHIERVPEGEREEIRQIFARKGLEGDALEQVVDTITAQPRLWIDTMLTEEYGLRLETPSPAKAGAVTFGAFAAAGLVPLVPYLVPLGSADASFAASCVVTAAAFFGVGWIKGHRVGTPRLRAAWATLWSGAAAAALAYFVGHVIASAFGTI